GHELLAQCRGGLAVEGEQQAAAGGAVEAVDQEDRLAEVLAQAVRGEVGLAAGERAVVDHQAGGLVDDREPVVGELHVHRRAYRTAKATSAPTPSSAATSRRCASRTARASSASSAERIASSWRPSTCCSSQACSSPGISGARVTSSGRRLRNSRSSRRGL